MGSLTRLPSLQDTPGTPGSGRSFAGLRRSFDAAARRTAFASHSPFDPAEAAADAAREDEPLIASALSGGLLSPEALMEPACGDDGPGPTWGDVGTEAKRLSSLAIPLMLQSLASMLLTLTSTIFVGHLNDPVALSGVVLASSVYNVTGISMVIGLSSGLDTLCGQAYGAKSYLMLGVYLQRAQAICWTLCVPVVLMWINAKPLLLAVGQDPEIVEVAASYLLILSPSLFLSAFSDTCRRYFLAQRVVMPGLAASVVTTALSPFFNYLFIIKLGWRTNGAALAVVCCNATNSLLLNGYRLVRDLSPSLASSPQRTWGGLDPRAALAGWGQYLTLGVPAAAMICLEWWVWELTIVAAGVLPNANVAVGVMGLMMQINSIFYMMPGSLGSAASTRVANALGAGNARGAELSFRVACGVTVVIASCAVVAIYTLRGALVAIFTSEPTTVALAMTVMPVMAMSMLGDSLVAVLGSVLRAAGRQGLGATLNIFGYWCVGLPLALFLGFRLGLAVLGFWIGLATAAALQALVFLGVILRLDWRQEVARAHRLLEANQEAGGGQQGSGRADGAAGGGQPGRGAAWCGGDVEAAAAADCGGGLREPLLARSGDGVAS